MKIFIIGPENSGKTILATMMNDYVENNPECGLGFYATDYKTKKYLKKTLKTLKSEEWPESTKIGESITLSWKWTTQHGSEFVVNMPELAGQTLRSVICESESNPLLQKEINEADLVILLCDIKGYLDEKGKNADAQTEVAWMFEEILKNASMRQNVICVITKADLWENELPQEQWHHRQAVEALLMKYFDEVSWNGLKKHLERCTLLAVSSVSVADKMIDKKLSHVPKVPLKSRGMDNLIAEILKAMKINVHDSDGTEKNLGVNTLPPEKASGKNPVTDILKIVAIASALSVILWMFGLFYSWAGFFISIVIITIAVFGLKKLFGSFINKGPEK
jgi:nicotinamide riboside kinase